MLKHIIYSGIAKTKLKDFTGAIHDYSRAIELVPKYAEVYNNRGIAKLNLKDNEGACIDLRIALKLGYQSASDHLREVCN